MVGDWIKLVGETAQRGILEGDIVEQSDPDRWRQTLEVNLFGAYHCTRLAIPQLRRRG